MHPRYLAITCTILWISGALPAANLLFLVNKNESYSRNLRQTVKKIGKADDLSERPGGKPSTPRSRTCLPRPSRRTLNILRTSPSKLFHHQRKAVEIRPREERQELVAQTRQRIDDNRRALSTVQCVFQLYNNSRTRKSAPRSTIRTSISGDTTDAKNPLIIICAEA